MSSSTSSSDGHGAIPDTLDGALLLVAKNAAFIAILGLLGACALQLLSSRFASNAMPYGNGVEGNIVLQQMKRSHELRDLDILVIGDSSALMGIDAVEFGHKTNQRVESLATLGWVGPLGYAKLIGNYLKSNGSIPCVILALNNVSLQVEEKTYRETGYEMWVLRDVVSKKPDYSQANLLEIIKSDPFNRLIDMPLPGKYGEYYGFESNLRKTIENGNGSMIDPNEMPPLKNPEPLVIAMTPPFVSRLPHLKNALHDRRIGKVYIAITPTPHSMASAKTKDSFDKSLVSLGKQLDLPEDSLLDTPYELPDRYFATGSHLNKTGRAHYTRAVYQALR